MPYPIKPCQSNFGVFLHERITMEVAFILIHLFFGRLIAPRLLNLTARPWEGWPCPDGKIFCCHSRPERCLSCAHAMDPGLMHEHVRLRGPFTRLCFVCGGGVHLASNRVLAARSELCTGPTCLPFLWPTPGQLPCSYNKLASEPPQQRILSRG